MTYLIIPGGNVGSWGFWVGEITESMILGWGKYTRGIYIRVGGTASVPLPGSLPTRGSIWISVSGILGNILSAGGTQSAEGTYLGEILGKGKQKYFRLRYSVFGFRPKA